MLWRFAVVHRQYGDLEVISPVSGIGLVDKGGHADKAAPMNVQYGSCGVLLLLLEVGVYAGYGLCH